MLARGLDDAPRGKAVEDVMLAEPAQRVLPAHRLDQEAVVRPQRDRLVKGVVGLEPAVGVEVLDILQDGQVLVAELVQRLRIDRIGGLAQRRALDDDAEAIALGHRLQRIQRLGEVPAMAALATRQPVVAELHQHPAHHPARDAVAWHQRGLRHIRRQQAAGAVGHDRAMQLVDGRSRQRVVPLDGLGVDRAGQREAATGIERQVADPFEDAQRRPDRGARDTEALRQRQLADRRPDDDAVAGDHLQDLAHQLGLERAAPGRPSAAARAFDRLHAGSGFPGPVPPAGTAFYIDKTHGSRKIAQNRSRASPTGRR